MNEVSANMPMAEPNVATVTKPEMQEVQEPPKEAQITSLTPEEMPEAPKDGLERIPETDSVELGANPGNLKALKAPSTKQVVEGLGAATTICIALKSFVQSLGDLWHTTKDNFQVNKNKAMLKQAQKQAEAKTEEAA